MYLQGQFEKVTVTVTACAYMHGEDMGFGFYKYITIVHLLKCKSSVFCVKKKHVCLHRIDNLAPRLQRQQQN